MSIILQRRAERHTRAHRSSFSLLSVATGSILLSWNVLADTRAIELPRLTVTATLSERDARTAPAAVSIVDRAELERRAPGTLLEAIRGLPGFTLSPRQVGGRKTLALRGMEGKHVLVLVDGRRIAASDDVVGHSDYQYGWLPIESIERIEVIRGPMSVLYGSEALGGVINVITQRPHGSWTGQADVRGVQLLEGNGGDGYRTTASTGGPLGDRIGVRIEAERSRFDPVQSEENPLYVDQEGTDVRTGGATVHAALTTRQQLEIDGRVGEEERWYGDVTRTGLSYVNTYILDRNQAHLGWRGDFEGWNAQLRAYRSSIDIRNRRTQAVAETRPQYMRDNVIDGHVTSHLGGHRLTAGFELREEYLRNAGLTGGEDDADHRAVFVQDEFWLSEQLSVTGGVRADDHEFFGGELSPRVFLVHEINEAWVLKAGYGHAFKAPTLKQVSPRYIGAEGPHTFLGNAAIQPESSGSFELAADYLRGPLNVRMNVFENRVRDLITYDLIGSIGPRNIYRYDNVDRARIRGVEAGTSVDLPAGLRVNAELTLLRTRDRDTGQDLDYRPDHTVNVSLDWTSGRGWSARVGAQRIGEQQSDIGELPAYTLWNASLARTFNRHWRVQLNLENIGNVRLADEPVDYGYAERGRSASLSLGTSF